MSVKDWKLKDSPKVSRDFDSELGSSRTAGEDIEKEFDCKNDIPVENVRKQLGFTKRRQLIMGDAKLPFCEIFRN